ncbi:CPBP family intramembrane glutamic endopeptidase [Aestuariibaculum sediminum]|uniref:CPBP family intramembrane metalloprotease n=1 Tax=Aestuariibaculum sediminum TaxID=2770637 RepID=A0A8J6Q2P7_9FLAO|nr:CPBP family intramembrane glutamic endopeptidase [Aestuariibaculum sediminum]MBD0832459.1 CPBP family intramembrane metalloprotease [Aestuariibaculum sediminum]
MTTDIVILVLLLPFFAYFLISYVFKKLHVNNLETSLQVTNGLKLLNLKHILGIIFFGVFPFVVLTDYQYLILTLGVMKLKVLILFLLFFFLSAYAAMLGVNNNKLKEQGNGGYRFSDAKYYFFIRIVFLLCYEFFFRGVLLFYFLDSTSLTLSITYVTVLYVLIHAFDSKREIIGAIPFGIILCLFSVYTQSIWYPFLIHLALSAIYEISIFYQLTLNKNSMS